MASPPAPSWLPPITSIDQEFLQRLERLAEKKSGPQPVHGSWRLVKDLDPRLEKSNPMLVRGVSVGPKAMRKIPLYLSIARVRDRKTEIVYLAFQETMQALLLRQADPQKYPLWLFESGVKDTERKIHIQPILRKPEDEDDNLWLGGLPDTPEGEKQFNTICYFLLTEGIVSPTMFRKT